MESKHERSKAFFSLTYCTMERDPSEVDSIIQHPERTLKYTNKKILARCGRTPRNRWSIAAEVDGIRSVWRRLYQFLDSLGPHKEGIQEAARLYEYNLQVTIYKGGHVTTSRLGISLLSAIHSIGLEMILSYYQSWAIKEEKHCYLYRVSAKVLKRQCFRSSHYEAAQKEGCSLSEAPEGILFTQKGRRVSLIELSASEWYSDEWNIIDHLVMDISSRPFMHLHGKCLTIEVETTDDCIGIKLTPFSAGRLVELGLSLRIRISVLSQSAFESKRER